MNMAVAFDQTVLHIFFQKACSARDKIKPHVAAKK